MASLMCRNLMLQLSRRVHHTTIRCAGGYPFIKTKGKVAKEEVSVADPFGHSVGPERFELLARAKDIVDPFELDTQVIDNTATRQNPNLVSSLYGVRMIGCLCEPDALNFVWWNLTAGEPQRCMCGYWFKLVKEEPLDLDVGPDDL